MEDYPLLRALLLREQSIQIDEPGGTNPSFSRQRTASSLLLSEQKRISSTARSSESTFCLLRRANPSDPTLFSATLTGLFTCAR